MIYLWYFVDLIFFLFKKIFIRILLSSLLSPSSVIRLDEDDSDDSEILMNIFLNKKKIKSAEYERYVRNIKSSNLFFLALMPSFVFWFLIFFCSSKLSISINEKTIGYFSCCRGVRQGDPLSPILFCSAKQDLSRNAPVPSHCLYADDVLIFFMLPHNPCVLFLVTLMRFSVNRASIYICVCVCVRKYIWGGNTWKCYTLIVYVDILSLLTL